MNRYFASANRSIIPIIAVLFLFPASPAVKASAGEIRISFLVFDTESTTINEAAKEISQTKPDVVVRFFTTSELCPESGNPDPETVKWIRSSHVIFVQVMDDRLARFVLEQVGRGEESGQEAPIIYAVGASSREEELAQKGFRFDKEIRRYYRNLSPENIKNMILYTLCKHFDSSVTFKPPREFPDFGIYHPEADRIFESFDEYAEWYGKRSSFRGDFPWVGLMFFGSEVSRKQTEVIDRVVRKLESAGFNVVPAFGYPDDEVIRRFYLIREKEKVRSRVSLIVSFSLKFSSSLSEEVKKAVESLNIPIINAVKLFMNTVDQWRASPVGIDIMEVAWALANPEVSGLIEPSVLGGKKGTQDPETGKTLYSQVALESHIDFLVSRIKKWLDLQRKPNPEKRVAILYYNHSQGKQNIGASYLNVFRSLELILGRMKKEGYSVEGAAGFPDENALKEMILAYGRNIGSWAPGELEKLVQSGRSVTVPMETYLRWFERLPEDFRRKVTDQWGPPEASTVMVYNGNIVIPADTLGNIVLMPEPARGWSDDPVKLYHSPTLYPHHQYIAAYLWLKYGFKADAMVHLGTHATHEWLPGKQAGLSMSCPPEVLITDIPNIYPYIVDDVGEGIQAKRRGRGVIIDHLVPPVKKGGLYAEYAEIYEMIQGYHQARTMGSPTTEEQLRRLIERIEKLGLLKDLGMGFPSPDKAEEGEIEQILETLEHYLDEIREGLIPYGLHTFGSSPVGEALEEMVDSILEVQRKAGNDVNPEEVSSAIVASGPAEIDALMAALNGKFVPSGEGNDPLRNLKAIPTGKNFYGFNPQKIPTKEAYKLGKEAAEQIIRDALNQKGSYPEQVAIVLWAVETMRNGGVNESTILYLMGIEPVWDNLGRVTGLKPIPGKKLGRPRIDVLINPSGLYRDLFPEKLKLLDRAVKLAAIQEDVENLIRKHSEILEHRLLSEGYSPDQAKKLSAIRIFSEPSGTYGTGVSEMVSISGIWEKDDEIVDVYLNRVGYAFGEDLWGVDAKELFKAHLASVDTVVHSFSSNIFGAMDNDDVFQYVGGLALAARKFGGKPVRTMITLQRIPGQVGSEPLAKILGSEMRMRYLNPKWIEGMKKEGYGGAREMAKFVEYFWGFQVTTPEAVHEEEWRQIYEVYVEDKYGMDLQEFFRRANPWAYQSITARMLEAIRKGYWKADEQTKRRLAVEYARSVVEHGVACCDHTCNNPLLNQMVASIISIPGLLEPRISEKFEMTLSKAIGENIREQQESLKKLREKLQQKPGGPESSASSSSREKKVEGYRMEEVKKDTKPSETMPTSGLRALILFALLIFAMVLLISIRRGMKQ
ncbi:cobaltochelatase subunit CobN [Thermodesulforhabdus norvegica]|uniref:Cobaltochelatase CobN n=1 Tax=Thermodesulforhabdus norvegica TaxID=39841 RepID=A0A1I4QXJ5_9BACT|nr:cobaltochelatase subunit CobN [Thermodesulforhabdus norvegica]SFM44727.1 cobaltochelatase CobN [Thermodesulforhabdus norvegica]